MNKLTPLILTALLLAPLAGTTADPGHVAATSRGNKATAGRIAVRNGSFVDVGTGRSFRPVGVNYYRLGPVAEGKQGHAAFSPGLYDERFITRMMEELPCARFNTVRSFLSNYSGTTCSPQKPGASVNPSQTAPRGTSVPRCTSSRSMARRSARHGRPSDKKDDLEYHPHAKYS